MMMPASARGRRTGAAGCVSSSAREKVPAKRGGDDDPRNEPHRRRCRWMDRERGSITALRRMMSLSSCPGGACPVSPIVRSSSARTLRRTPSTPCWTPSASPHMYGRLSSTASAPSATALAESEPERPAVEQHDELVADASTIAGSASSEATAPSTWRPPWLETTIPSMPRSRASRRRRRAGCP